MDPVSFYLVAPHLPAPVLKLDCASESPGRFLETQSWAPCPRVSDSAGLGWGLRICLSHKAPGATAAATAGLGTTIWEPFS